MAEAFLLAMVGGYGVGAVGAVAAPSDRAARGLTALGAVVGGLAGLGLAGATLIAGATPALALSELFSAVGGVSLRLDRLGAFFLALVSLGAVPAAIFGLGYTRSYEGRRSLGQLGLMLNLFLLTMSLVPLADNVLTFIAMWEGMSLTSYFLVMTEHDEPETVRAGNWYLAMTQVGLAFLLSAFFLLAGGGPGDFAELRASATALPEELRAVIFVLAVIGFGAKAGLVPLHVWLPRAHPAAPSHISALMSGVMIKLGVYGILRMGLDLLGGGPPWWGVLLLVLGAASAVLGILYALHENDLKRLLAYSSVENVGIIVIALGAGLMFQAYSLPGLAALAFTGALYHALNHAAFKSLLFLGAGAVLHATGTRDMDALGGLIKRMPRTAAMFLLGAAAISALPPLNGFVSEWLVLQALLGGASIPQAEVAVMMPIAVAMLALTGGLAAACFVKAFGITFLGMSRSLEADRAHEASPSMQIGMGLPAIVSVALGLGAFAIVPAIESVWTGMGGVAPGPLTLGLGFPAGVAAGYGTMSPSLIMLSLVVVLVLLPLALRVFGAARGLRVGATWGCGRIGQTPRMQYTGASFAEPLRRVFAALYRPAEDLSLDVHPESRYFVQTIAYRARITPWIDRYVYDPVIALVKVGAARARALQSGSVHAYLTYLVAAMVVLLAVLMAWPD